MTYTIIIDGDRNRRMALDAVRKVRLGQQVKISKPTRTSDQNRRWWSQLAAIAKAEVQWADATWDQDGWHDIILSAFLHHKKMETGKLIRGIEGETLVVGRLHSSNLTTEDFNEMMEMTVAFMDQHGVEWIERDTPPDDAYMGER